MARVVETDEPTETTDTDREVETDRSRVPGTDVAHPVDR